MTVRRALDKDTGEVILPKSGKPREVPISLRLAEALDALPKRGLWIVSRLDGGALGYDGLLEAIGALYDRAAVARPIKPIHCLRHTFGTEMARKVDVSTLQELMGHEELKTTRLYIKVNAQQKRDAIALVFGVRQQVGNSPAEKKEGA